MDWAYSMVSSIDLFPHFEFELFATIACGLKRVNLCMCLGTYTHALAATSTHLASMLSPLILQELLRGCFKDNFSEIWLPQPLG